MLDSIFALGFGPQNPPLLHLPHSPSNTFSFLLSLSLLILLQFYFLLLLSRTTRFLFAFERERESFGSGVVFC